MSRGEAFDKLTEERNELHAKVQRLESAIITLSDNYIRNRQQLRQLLSKSRDLLRRAYNGMHKESWAEGESEAEVCQAIIDFIDNTQEGGP